MKTKTSHSYLLWGIIGFLIIISMGTFFYFSKKESTTEHIDTDHPPIAESLASNPIAQNEQLVSASLIQQPISQNSTLAHEELDRLKDIESQLLAQEQNLNAQHQDADQLIKLKEEQIELLSKQLNPKHP